jgi:hypothetical protein
MRGKRSPGCASHLATTWQSVRRGWSGLNGDLHFIESREGAQNRRRQVLNLWSIPATWKPYEKATMGCQTSNSCGYPPVSGRGYRSFYVPIGAFLCMMLDMDFRERPSEQ